MTDEPRKKKPSVKEDDGAKPADDGDEPDDNPDEPGTAGTAGSDDDEVKVDEDDDEPTRALTYYADTKPIIDAKCTPCHVEGGIGPMPLTSYKEITPFLPLIKVDVM